MAPESIPAGSNYADELTDAITNCSLFILMLSKKAQESQWVAKEVNLAVSENKPILPFQLEECKLINEFRLYLTNIHMYRAYENKEYATQKMLNDVLKLLEHPPKKINPPDPHRTVVCTPDDISKKENTSTVNVTVISNTVREESDTPISWGFVLLSSFLNIALITLLAFLFGDKLLTAANLSEENLAYFWGFIIFGTAITLFSNIILRKHLFPADHSRKVHIGVCFGSMAASTAGSLLYIPLLHMIPFIIILFGIYLLFSVLFGK